MYVSWSYTHSCVITDKGYPYAWGNNKNGRWGVATYNNIAEGLEDDSESDEDKDVKFDENKDEKYIENPRLIFSMRKILKTNKIEDKKIAKEVKSDDYLFGEESDDSDDENRKITNYKFDIQDQLKEYKNALSEESLKTEDQSLGALLGSLIKRINENIKILQNSRFNQFFKTETSIIASLYNFSIDINSHINVKSQVPNSIMMNKHIYEKIFSLLQIHPWYIK